MSWIRVEDKEPLLPRIMRRQTALRAELEAALSQGLPTEAIERSMDECTRVIRAIAAVRRPTEAAAIGRRGL